jgi:FkbM family methyltransferase
MGQSMLPRVNLARSDTADYLVFGTSDFISRTISEMGDWDPNIQILTKLITLGMPEPLVIDVGANLGAYSVPTGKMVRESGGTVYAFEPQRIVFYQLCGNIFLNQLDNVIAFNLAIGAANEMLDLPVPDYSAMTNIGGYSIDTKTRKHTGIENAMSGKTEGVTLLALDSFCFPKAPAFIKIDVEGCELAVLQGATKLLKESNYPPIYFEAWNLPWFTSQRAELMAFVKSLGYEATKFKGDDYVAQHPSNAVHVNIKAGNDGKLQLDRIR